MSPRLGRSILRNHYFLKSALPSSFQSKHFALIPTDCFFPTSSPSQHLRPTCLSFRFFYQRHQQRPNKSKKSKKSNPFRLLGLHDDGVTKYQDVKKHFLKIALENHPDTQDRDSTEEEQDEMRERFIQARMAFESIVEDEDGWAVWVEEVVDREDRFDAWFQSETGLQTPFQFDMDPETMKEVASMTEEIGGGLDRDGGMWCVCALLECGLCRHFVFLFSHWLFYNRALARMVTSTVKTGGDAASILRLEAGDVKEKCGHNGTLRRRRKR